MWRCVNDIFGYCKDEPNGEMIEVKVIYKDIAGKKQIYTNASRHCTSDPKTCKHYRTVQQVYHKELAHTAV